MFSSCSQENKFDVDKLNTLSYASHYRSIDSTERYARQVLDASPLSDDQRAEALNNLAFCAMVRMDYQLTDSLLNEALATTDNQVELLVAEVQQMRLCQRRSQNRAFYEHREQANTHLQRINEERSSLSPRLRQRLVYAESEMAIVNSTYYYYVGLELQSVEAMRQVNTDEIRRDTAQYLNYLYNIGAGGALTDGDAEQIYKEEMDCLQRCLSIAQRHGYPYFVAQAKEALADHTGEVALAEEALALFQQFGDIYQIAGAYRTLASCYHAMGDDAHALENLQQALSDQRIEQAPDLVASIREQLSVVCSALDDKPNSDLNRNIYIDLQEQTRQDRELEARAGLLDVAVRQLNWMMLAVVGAIVLLIALLWFFNHLNKKSQEDHQLDDLLEQKNEEVAEARLRVGKNERRHLEQRAKVSLAMSILPLIERIVHTIGQLSNRKIVQSSNGKMVQSSNSEMDYIRELTDKINEQNDLLTQWIQLRQGELSLHVESFPLQGVFDIVARSRQGFAMRGVELDVTPTTATVKADRVLTLFMLNTLADNARKFTDQGGRVTISAREENDYVEISVRDTGRGMSPDELAHVFDNKPIRDPNQNENENVQRPPSNVQRPPSNVQRSTFNVQRSHGFGLMNCKGIIERYRKISRIFSVCQLSAESEQGRGSRFFFRLPVGRLLAIGLWLMAFGLTANGQPPTANRQPPRANSQERTAVYQAHIYADSAYFCNVNGTYERTLLYADSCLQYLNRHYLQQHPKGRLLMLLDGEGGVTPAEIRWLQQGVETNYQVILDVRNECAVAALALHRWALYNYNNKVYTQLFKELSADSTLADYCRQMQQSRANKRIAIILLLVLFVMIVPAYYMLYYRHRLERRFRREHQQQTNIEMAEDELRRAELEDANLHVANAVLDNCLSTLKHETMYYPSRIRQLVDSGDVESLSEVAAYYRELYGMLIQQATAQVERIHLHIRPVTLYGQQVLGDENLLHYLFELLLEVSGERLEVRDMITSEVKDDKYVAYHIALTSHLSPLTSLIARQIVRDHGEATNRRGCGITTDNGIITIILPRYNGKI